MEGMGAEVMVVVATSKVAGFLRMLGMEGVGAERGVMGVAATLILCRNDLGVFNGAILNPKP